MPLELLAEIDSVCAEWGYKIQRSSFKDEAVFKGLSLSAEIDLKLIKTVKESK